MNRKMCFYGRLAQNGKKVEIISLTSLYKKAKNALISHLWKKRNFTYFQMEKRKGLFQNGDLSCCVLKNVLLAKL